MMRRACALAAVLAVLAAARDAHAVGGTAFSETSRTAALADAVSARPGDAGTILFNPAGLADMREAQVVLGGHGDYVSQYFQPANELASQDRSRGFGGFYFAAATPLPGPAWARRIAVGVALDVPAQYLLHLDVPTRLDQPSSPIYDGRPDKLASAFALAFKVLPRLELGAGFLISPALALPTLVTYSAGRAPSVNDNVEVRIDSSLDLAVVPVLGVRAQPFDWLGLALVYRDAQISRATGTQTTTAGGIVAPDSIDFYSMWDPATVIVGTAFEPNKRLSLSLDVTWRQWSAFRTGFDTALDRPYRFNDTVSVSSGVELEIGNGFAIRGGVGVEPTPIPTQSGPTNYLGGNTFVAALGAGFDFRRIAKLPFAIDVHVRGRFDAAESAMKDPAALPDADATLGGQQIDNMGYPGFRSQAFMFQGGATATLFIGGKDGL